MIKITILHTQIPTRAGEDPVSLHCDPYTSYIAAERVDTITDPRGQGAKVPQGCRSIVRYDCRLNGYRIFFVAEEAEALARARNKELYGQDSNGEDWSEYAPSA